MPRAPHSSPQTMRVFDALLSRPADWRYGYDLSRETGLQAGTLYPILIRLAGQELLETRWEPADQAGRPPRHLYRLTASGAELARDRTATRDRTAARKDRRATATGNPAASGTPATSAGSLATVAGRVRGATGLTTSPNALRPGPSAALGGAS